MSLEKNMNARGSQKTTRGRERGRGRGIARGGGLEVKRGAGRSEGRSGPGPAAEPDGRE